MFGNPEGGHKELRVARNSQQCCCNIPRTSLLTAGTREAELVEDLLRLCFRQVKAGLAHRAGEERVAHFRIGLGAFRAEAPFGSQSRQESIAKRVGFRAEVEGFFDGKKRIPE